MRDDTRAILPSPATSTDGGMPSVAILPSTSYFQLTPSRPNDSVNEGSLPVVIQAAMRQDIELSWPGERDRIIAKVATLKTRSDAATYLAGVAAKLSAVSDHPTN
jgi:hypothetical protein